MKYIDYDITEDIDNYEVTILIPSKAYPGDTLQFYDNNDNLFNIEIKSGRPGMTLKTTIKKIRRFAPAQNQKKNYKLKKNTGAVTLSEIETSPRESLWRLTKD